MRGRGAVFAAAAAIAALATWYSWRGDEGAIEDRLAALAEDINATAGTGLGAGAHAAQIGRHFTDSAVVDLGQGAPIEGRATIVGMLARLEPRTAQFTVRFQDTTVRALTDGAAEVNLTAEISSRGEKQRDTWMDAREFAVSFRKVGDDWLIASVRAVETIR